MISCNARDWLEVAGLAHTHEVNNEALRKKNFPSAQLTRGHGQVKLPSELPPHLLRQIDALEMQSTPSSLIPASRSFEIWPAQQEQTTYGHAHEGLLGLANVTLGHCEGCARNRRNNKKKERRWGGKVECRERRDTSQQGWGKREEREKEKKGGRGEEKKKNTLL